MSQGNIIISSLSFNFHCILVKCIRIIVAAMKRLSLIELGLEAFISNSTLFVVDGCEEEVLASAVIRPVKCHCDCSIMGIPL